MPLFFLAGTGNGHKLSHPNFDTLDKALTVFKMNDRPDRVHRRLDLIFAPWCVYWTAVVGWYVIPQRPTSLPRV